MDIGTAVMLDAGIGTTRNGGTAMADEVFPVTWSDRHAVVTLPEHVDATNTGPLRDALLGLVNRGPEVLVADMTGTVSCDHGGADALVRAYQRASVSGTQLKIAATSPLVRRILTVSGLDRLVSVYPSLEAALAARRPQPAPLARSGRANGGRPGIAALAPAVLWSLIDALADGIILVTGDGTLALANRQAESMFGYQHGGRAGQPVEALVPDVLRAGHAVQRTAYQHDPTERDMSTRDRLVGLRADGTTFPIQVSLSPVPTTTGQLTLAVVRDLSHPAARADLATLARAIAAGQEAPEPEFLDRVTSGLYHVGLSLQAAESLSRQQAVRHIEAALGQLDDLIREIRDRVFTRHSRPPRADRS
jgi:anti-anti-sigma factor